MKMFAVYVGGEAPGAHIELHDMRFVLGETIQDTYPELKRQWWGTPGTMHVDGWAELTQADGYRIELKQEKPADITLKLYYVNVGGYDSAKFTELHENIFVVAESEQKAKVRALQQVKHWDSLHRDDLYEAEQCFDLTVQLGKGWHIHLEADESAGTPPFTCRYLKLAA